jgi:hypothetical protein
MCFECWKNADQRPSDSKQDRKCCKHLKLNGRNCGAERVGFDLPSFLQIIDSQRTQPQVRMNTGVRRLSAVDYQLSVRPHLRRCCHGHGSGEIRSDRSCFAKQSSKPSPDGQDEPISALGEGFIFWTAAPCATRSTFRSTCVLLLVPLVYSPPLYVVASLSSAAMPSLVSLL